MKGEPRGGGGGGGGGARWLGVRWDLKGGTQEQRPDRWEGRKTRRKQR